MRNARTALRSSVVVHGPYREFSGPVGFEFTFASVTSLYTLVAVYGVPLATLKSMLMPSSSNGWKLPHVAPSALPSDQSSDTDSLWRWSKSSGAVCLGASEPVQAMF